MSQYRQEIGGYFELELPVKDEFYPNAIRLNTGRNALEYILRAQAYKKLYLPYFSCGVMLEPCQKLGIPHEFYSIDIDFRPVIDWGKLNKNETILYINYFGICDHIVKEVIARGQNVIIDNAQAFFSDPLQEADTFYSPRKFFGIPDGGYLFTKNKLRHELKKDFSLTRMKYLIGRIEENASDYYNTFKEVNTSLKYQPIKKMSNLTHRLLCSIDYEKAKEKRVDNFNILHSSIGGSNQLNIKTSQSSAPMVYPWLNQNGSKLKEYLIQQKVYVPTYWPEVEKLVSDNRMEYNLVKNLVCLPIDQRYLIKDMYKILKLVKEFPKGV